MSMEPETDNMLTNEQAESGRRPMDPDIRALSQIMRILEDAKDAQSIVAYLSLRICGTQLIVKERM